MQGRPFELEGIELLGEARGERPATGRDWEAGKKKQKKAAAGKRVLEG